MSIIPQFYLNAVVSIGRRVSDEIKWIATGFFALRKAGANGSGYPFLITNKHVLINKDAIVIRIRKTDCEDFDTVDVPLKENDKCIYVWQPCIYHRIFDLDVCLHEYCADRRRGEFFV